MSGGFEVDLDECRTSASHMLTVGDDLQASAKRGVLEGRDGYTGAGLPGAAGCFGDRFRYAIDSLGAEAIDAGGDLRAAAQTYEDADRVPAEALCDMACTSTAWS
jgi:hypothetical protein